MLPHLDTYCDAVRIERELTVKRADRQAPLFESIKRSAPIPTLNQAGPEPAPWTRLAGVIRPLRAVLRPAHT